VSFDEDFSRGGEDEEGLDHGVLGQARTGGWARGG